MTPDTIPDGLRNVFATILEMSPEQVTADLSPQTSGQWDSLKNMELILAVEAHFDLKFSGADIAGLDSVKGYCLALSRIKHAGTP